MEFRAYGIQLHTHSSCVHKQLSVSFGHAVRTTTVAVTRTDHGVFLVMFLLILFVSENKRPFTFVVPVKQFSY